jgi:hypothetical protein
MPRFAGPAGLALVAAATALAVVGLAGGRAGDESAAAAAPRSPESDPAAFVVRTITLLAANRYDALWPSLHPAQRRVAGRSEYVRCEAGSPIPGRLASIRTTRISEERVALGVGRSVPSMAVGVRLEIRDATSVAPIVVTDTVHVVQVGRRWTWILPPARVEQYAAGLCPGEAGGPPSA